MIIFLASQKGGSGKSTICASLAGLLGMMGYMVLIADADPQGTSADWVEARSQNRSLPLIEFAVATGTPDKFEKYMNALKPKYDFILVDLQGADTKDNRKKLLNADKIIFPFKPSQADLNTLKRINDMHKDLVAHKPELEGFYVLNECPTTSATEVKEARAFFEFYDIPLLPNVIHSRKIFRDTMASGMSASEMKNPKADDEIKALLAAVLGAQVEDIEAQVSHTRTRVSDNAPQTVGV